MAARLIDDMIFLDLYDFDCLLDFLNLVLKSISLLFWLKIRYLNSWRSSWCSI